MRTPAEDELLNLYEIDFRRMTDEENRQEEAEKFVREHPGTPLTQDFMGFWKRWQQYG